MSTINITITAPVQDFSVFADELGYQTMVTKSPEELVLLPQPVSIQDSLKPNPQTKVQFLETYFKNVVVGELYKRKASIIDGQVDSVKEAEKVTLRGALAGAVGVTSVI